MCIFKVGTLYQFLESVGWNLSTRCFLANQEPHAFDMMIVLTGDDGKELGRFRLVQTLGWTLED